jgi:hypothetical protein
MTELPSSVHEAAAKHSDPLYLSKPWLQGGHTSQKANGTITYVQYGGDVYGVTCAHIYDQQFAVEPNLWLTIHGKKRYIYQLGGFTADGYRSSLRPLRKPEEREGPDIAILRLDDAFKEIHLTRRGKAAINLDTWSEPAWNELKCPVAFGYPTEHKTDTEEFLQAPFAAVVAELTRPISPESESFLMASSLEKENSFYFSGMSGGAVYAVSDSDPLITFVGIVFEGVPGSSKEWESRSTDSFYTKNDIQIRAHTVTPTIFGTWLAMAGWR